MSSPSITTQITPTAILKSNPNNNPASTLPTNTPIIILPTTITIIPKSVTPSTTNTLVKSTNTHFWDHYCLKIETPFPIFRGAPNSKREEYIEINIEQGVCLGASYAFCNDFTIAVTNKENWIQYPEKIALRFTCFPHPENPCPDELIIYQISSDEIVILETLWRVPDDQWGALEYRVDLKNNHVYWYVEWAGQRWQCRNNRGKWTNSVC
jgi:hypothetical protein